MNCINVIVAEEDYPFLVSSLVVMFSTYHCHVIFMERYLRHALHDVNSALLFILNISGGYLI